MPDFPTRDPALPDFWNQRFGAGFTPWDQGAVPPSLRRFVADSGCTGLRVLIPGCGSAYEAGWLDECGFAVTAIDYAAGAIERARTVLDQAVATRVLRQADFFSFDAQPF